MRPSLRLRCAVALAFIATVTPVMARAQTFTCDKETAGQLSCQAGTTCSCSYFHMSAMEGTPAGWRWNCDILQPRCGENLPATIENYGDVIPDSLSITEQSVTVERDNQQLQWVAPDFGF